MLYYNSVLKLICFNMFSCPHAGRPRRPRHTGKLGSDSWVARGGRPRMPRQGYTVPYKNRLRYSICSRRRRGRPRRPRHTGTWSS